MSITNKKLNELFRKFTGNQQNVIISVQKDIIKSELKKVAAFYEDPDEFIESKKYGNPKADWLEGFMFVEMPQNFKELNPATKKWAEDLGFEIFQLTNENREVCVKIKFEDETLKAIEAFK